MDIDGIREPVAGSLPGNNIISGAVVPSSDAIGLHLYPVWEAGSLDEWLYNGGPPTRRVSLPRGIFCYMGREWELSYRLGMRPWVCVAYSASGCSSAVFLVYRFGQGASLTECRSASGTSTLVFRPNTTSLCIHSICWRCQSLRWLSV